MNFAFAIPIAIVLTYGTPPAIWFAWRYWIRRRQAHAVSDAAELVAIDAWLDRIKATP